MKRALAPLVCLAIATSACAKSSSSATGSAGPRELTVFAASSLTGAFSEIGNAFGRANPGTKVTFNFGPSDGLAAQIESEGVADVFASASPTWMDNVAKKGPGIADRADFARNKLIVIVPRDNPAGIRSFHDLAGPGVKLVLAAKGVPVGDYAREALTSAGIDKQAEANVVSNEQDDASVVQKIVSGEADAAIVYASDVTRAIATQVKVIQIPDNVNVIATYPIGVVAGSGEPGLAKRFVDYVTSGAGQAVLTKYGFLSPS